MSTPNTAVSVRLTPAEAKRFRTAEAQVDADLLQVIRHQESALKYARRLGANLARIKEKGWYQAEYGTWPVYLAKRFPRLKKSQAHAYVTVATIFKDLEGEGSSAGRILEDGSIKSILPLTQLNPSVRADAYDAAKTDPGKPPTSESVKNTVEKLLAEPDPEKQQEMAKEQGRRIREEGKRVEAKRADDDRVKRLRKILLNARLCRKDGRALGGEGEQVVEWAENIMKFAADELGLDYHQAGLRAETA